MLKRPRWHQSGPQSYPAEGRWMGIDEAGRGSVLGPMVVAAFTFEASQQASLQATGVTDSKRLSSSRRERMLPSLERLGRFGLRVVEATDIDARNLNELELEAFCALIDEARPDRVFLDAPCSPAAIPAFTRRLESLLSCRPALVVEPKADLNHHVVGAASVAAKVRRDLEVSRLGEVGSGYPSDPVTRRYLSGLLQSGAPLPGFVRTRWGTLASLAQQPLPLGQELPAPVDGSVTGGEKVRG